MPGGEHSHTPLSRYVGVRLLHAPLVSLAAGVRYTDTTNGFRAYSRRFLADGRVAPFRSVFEGYELGDALQQANETLEDDFNVSERDGHAERVRPFTREELLKPLEKWFFGRS